VIPRLVEIERVNTALGRSPIVLVTGVRQAGKSTLVRELAGADEATYFDLENPRHATRLEDPMLTLEGLRGLVVIDEAQRANNLFPVLRVLADRPDRLATFLVLGSASPDLTGMNSESLAGRVEIVELGGFRLADVGAAELDRLWLHGGLPRSFSQSLVDSNAWRDNYIATFLERDLAQLGFRVPAVQMRRFWTMLAHYHAQTWNGAELSRALGVSERVTRRHLGSLVDALVVRQLQPWFVNTGKRLVKSPKVYVRDSGLLHGLLSIDSMDTLLNHPKVGASWEGFVVEQVAALVGATPLHFWGTQAGAEIDLVLSVEGKAVGLEIKRTGNPKVTPSIRNALADLSLDHVFIVYPGSEQYVLGDRVQAMPLVKLLGSDLATLVGE